MIYFHADDFGINVAQSKRIMKCRNAGCLNSVSIIATSEYLAKAMPLLDDECKKAVHINLCEGKALSDRRDIPLLTDKNGFFNKSFLKLLVMSLGKRKELEKEISHECFLQIQKILAYMHEGYELRIDSHRHYHMIPCVCRGLCDAIEKTGVEVEYFRVPMESFFLYFSEPRLLGRIQPLSVVKAIVLNTLALYNRSFLEKKGLWDKKCFYIGVIFTDRMFYNNIAPLLQRLIKRKDLTTENLEIQFHPGSVKKGEPILDRQFEDWYASKNRRQEAEALLRFRSELDAE